MFPVHVLDMALLIILALLHKIKKVCSSQNNVIIIH